MKFRFALLVLLLLGFGCQFQTESRLTQEKPISPVLRGKQDSDQTGVFLERLKALPGVMSVEEVPFDNEWFKGGWKVMFQQPLDHANPSLGSFGQKIYLNHSHPDAPVVFNLNGYSVPSNGFVSELVPWLDANFIHVEHRFFGESMPVPADYRFLDIRQAANDHHRLIAALKELYQGKWISTGISKGGQATIFHRSLFPDDVDVSIPYVAPVNLEREDTRLVRFLDEVGSPECRAVILGFQRDILGDYDRSFAVFSQKADALNLTFPMGLEKAFELSVMEFEFAFWQWTGGAICDQIPGKDASPEQRIDYLFALDAPGFFTESSIDYFFPFFHQAYQELGMYGYGVDSLEGFLREYTGYVDNYQTFISDSITVIYQPETLQNVNRFLQEQGDRFIYIYGENDAWSATAFEADTIRTEALTVFKKGGSHLTRITDLSPTQRQQVFQRLEEWLDLELLRLP